MHNPLSHKSSPEQTDAPKKSGFAPMRLAQALFSKQVKVKRDERGYKLALEGGGRGPQGDVAAPSHLSVSTAAEQPKPVPAAVCLRELMDSAPGSRNAFRHLASLEQTLQSKDPAAADGLFLFDWHAAHLKQALRQLDGLWMEPAPVALAELRGKLADALAAQERREKEEPAPSRGGFGVLSSFLVDEKMQVSEGRASDFHQLSESWGGPSAVPLQR